MLLCKTYKQTVVELRCTDATDSQNAMKDTFNYQSEKKHLGRKLFKQLPFLATKIRGTIPAIKTKNQETISCIISVK